MYVRVLGEVAAGPDADSLVRAPGRVPAALLAELALAQGRLVATTLLEDALWPPPAEVTRNALQAAVSRLRRRYGAATVESGPGGYRLPAPLTVDLVLAETALAAATASLAEGDHVRAESAAREGLALFAGQVLAGVELPAADAVRLRAQDARTGLVVVAARASAARGDADSALAELRSESAAHPLDERLAAATIDLLTGTGRATDAVQEHERYRRRLGDALGVDPAGPVRQAFARALAATEEPPPSRNRRTLPAPPTPFVGRAGERAALAEVLRDRQVRIVSVLGPGGIGKTRLALDVVGGLDPDPPVWWVPLASLTQGSLVLPAVAQALGCAESAGETLVEPIARALGSSPHVLVLDNAEHLVEAVAATVTELVGAVPALTVVVTSREPLHVAGEHRFPLGPLSDDDAVDLLVARTTAAGSPLAPGPAATAICRRLDGLPLAVELVAPRASVLDAEELLASLAGGLDHLGERRGGEPRQRTVRATIAWSVDLLDPPTRRAFAGLSVFRGGWSLDAALHVADADPDTVQLLLDKSLVQRVRGRLGHRFAMLETVREYAAELAAADRAGIEQRHTEHYLDALSRFGTHNPVRLDDAEHRWVADERENLRAVRERSAESHDDAFARVAALSWMDLTFSGAVGEAVAMLERALERTDDDLVRCSILDGLVLLLYRSDHPDPAQAYAARELDAARRCGDPVAMVDALRSLATADLMAATELADGSTSVRRSLSLALEVGDHWGAAAARVNLAVLAMNDRRLEEALVELRAALDDLDEGAAWYGRIVILSNMTETLLALGLVEDAVDVLVGIYDEDTWIEQRVWTTDVASKLAIEGGRHRDGLVLATAATEGLAALGQNREGITDDEHRRLVALAHGHLGAAEAAAAVAEGRGLGVDAAHARGREVVRSLAAR